MKDGNEDNGPASNSGGGRKIPLGALGTTLLRPLAPDHVGSTRRYPSVRAMVAGVVKEERDHASDGETGAAGVRRRSRFSAVGGAATDSDPVEARLALAALRPEPPLLPTPPTASGTLRAVPDSNPRKNAEDDEKDDDVVLIVKYRNKFVKSSPAKPHVTAIAPSDDGTIDVDALSDSAKGSQKSSEVVDRDNSIRPFDAEAVTERHGGEVSAQVRSAPSQHGVSELVDNSGPAKLTSRSMQNRASMMSILREIGGVFAGEDAYSLLGQPADPPRISANFKPLTSSPLVELDRSSYGARTEPSPLLQPSPLLHPWKPMEESERILPSHSLVTDSCQPTVLAPVSDQTALSGHTPCSSHNGLVQREDKNQDNSRDEDTTADPSALAPSTSEKLEPQAHLGITEIPPPALRAGRLEAVVGMVNRGLTERARDFLEICRESNGETSDALTDKEVDGIVGGASDVLCALIDFLNISQSWDGKFRSQKRREVFAGDTVRAKRSRTFKEQITEPIEFPSIREPTADEQPTAPQSSDVDRTPSPGKSVKSQLREEVASKNKDSTSESDGSQLGSKKKNPAIPLPSENEKSELSTKEYMDQLHQEETSLKKTKVPKKASPTKPVLPSPISNLNTTYPLLSEQLVSPLKYPSKTVDVPLTKSVQSIVEGRADSEDLGIESWSWVKVADFVHGTPHTNRSDAIEKLRKHASKACLTELMEEGIVNDLFGGWLADFVESEQWSGAGAVLTLLGHFPWDKVRNSLSKNINLFIRLKNQSKLLKDKGGKPAKDTAGRISTLLKKVMLSESTETSRLMDVNTLEPTARRVVPDSKRARSVTFPGRKEELETWHHYIPLSPLRDVQIELDESPSVPSLFGSRLIHGDELVFRNRRKLGPEVAWPSRWITMYSEISSMDDCSQVLIEDTSREIPFWRNSSLVVTRSNVRDGLDALSCLLPPRHRERFRWDMEQLIRISAANDEDMDD